jgi:hypothetical protein
MAKGFGSNPLAMTEGFFCGLGGQDHRIRAFLFGDEDGVDLGIVENVSVFVTGFDQGVGIHFLGFLTFLYILA